MAISCLYAQEILLSNNALFNKLIDIVLAMVACRHSKNQMSSQFYGYWRNKK